MSQYTEKVKQNERIRIGMIWLNKCFVKSLHKVGYNKKIIKEILNYRKNIIITLL